MTAPATNNQAPTEQPTENEEQYSGVAYQPVHWLHSLSTKVFGVLVLTSLFNLLVAVVLTAAVHRAVLEPYIPTEELRRLQNQLLAVGLFTGILALLISAAVAWLLARSFTQPIKQLMTGIKGVFRNDLSTRVQLARRDEFGSVAEFFNSLVSKLEGTRERNEALSRLKSEFVSVAAHQLRTPLTGLKWSLRWLAEDKQGTLTAEQHHAIDQQFKATDEMIELVNQLLDVAELEEGKFHRSLQQVEIGRLTGEVVDRFSAAAKVRKVTLSVNNNVRTGTAVIGDPGHLRLALANLVDNAIRYTRPGGSVTITLEQQPEKIAIRITDTGIGVPQPEQEKLFTKFFRASNAQRLQPNGSGLGLFIVRNVITGHGGTVTVTSRLGHGTTFTIVLPLRRELVPPESLPEGIGQI